MKWPNMKLSKDLNTVVIIFGAIATILVLKKLLK